MLAAAVGRMVQRVRWEVRRAISVLDGCADCQGGVIWVDGQKVGYDHRVSCPAMAGAFASPAHAAAQQATRRTDV